MTLDKFRGNIVARGHGPSLSTAGCLRCCYLLPPWDKGRRKEHNRVENRFYLQALGVTALFVVLLILFWTAAGGPASEAAIRNANSTRTSIAMTGSYLLQPRTRTPFPMTETPTSV